MARILIIEDSATYAAYAREILADYHEVDVAANGRDAAKLIERGNYDLVITDIFMPEQDGLETILQLRRTAPHIPLIAMSGAPVVGRADYLQVAMKFGAAAAIRKPFVPAELTNAVAAALPSAA